MSSAPATATDAVTKPDGIAALGPRCRPIFPTARSLGIFAVVMGAALRVWPPVSFRWGSPISEGTSASVSMRARGLAPRSTPSTMFIGPLTVYLGAMLGARRVLLVCGGVFAIVSACLPFAHSYSVLIVLLAIAGFSSGTFYPLTISFALLNVPLRYLALTLGVYATSIEGALNFAPSLYGFYRDHLSWTWMFWTSAIIAPVMMACVYFGVPASSASPGRRDRSRASPDSCTLSAGLALLLAALDQGQRLDWWRSGVFTALFASGAFFLSCAIVRRLRAPNPLVDLPYLRKWNTIALALGLFSFRFVLLATALVIPQSLPFRGLDAGAVRSSRAVDGGAGDVRRCLRSPPAEQGTRFAPADGPGVRDHWDGVPDECRVHQRVGGRELLQNRAPDGSRPVVRVRGARLHADPAVLLLRRPRLLRPVY